MYLTLALTLNIQRFILLQQNVWILWPPGKGNGQQILSKRNPAPVLEFIPLIELRILNFYDFLSILEHLKSVYPRLRHSQSMQRLLLLKEHLGGYAECTGGHWSHF